MKLQKIAQAAAVAMIATACVGGGDDPQQVSPDPTVANVTVPSTLAPVPETIESTTTVAVATTEPEPQSLAFSSTREVGRLFRIDTLQATFTGPGSEEALGQIEPGALVQTTSARESDGALWARVRSTSEAQTDLGWVPADALVPTTDFVSVSNPTRSTELRVARRTRDSIAIVQTPGSNEQVGTLQPSEVAMHGGEVATAFTGEIYLDVIDSVSKARIGWVKASHFGSIQSSLIQNGQHEALRTRPSSSTTYGAPLENVSITTVGCNATQLSFTNPSSSLGLAVVVGTATPQGSETRGVERWGAQGGGAIFIEPGDNATVTVITRQSSTWHFAQLDEDLRAKAARNADGTLTESPASATDVQQVQLGAGSCAPSEPEPDAVDSDSYINDLTPEEREEALAFEAEQQALLEAALEEETATVDSTTSVPETTVAPDTNTTAPDTTTTAPTTTTAAPTTTTTAAPSDNS